MHRNQWIGVGLLLAFLTLGCREATRSTAPVSNDPPQVATGSLPPLAGTPSCSNRGCHGTFETQPQAEEGAGDRPTSLSRFSFTRWQTDDPHARAYDVLFSPLGQRMGKLLGIDQGTDPRCLACHTNPQATGSTDWARVERLFGVGCEACHGSAQRWLVPHRQTAWQEKPFEARRAEYQEHGMNWLRSPTVRAEVCVGCHVGAPADPAKGIPARDVNHDLIAAGHPRLMFEFGAFLANLPKHWVEENTEPAFEARVWLIGQAASARASADLLVNHRAEVPELPWPEFAEYDCYACHQGIQPNSWRQRRGYSGRAGSPRPAAWYFALLPLVSATAGLEAPSRKPLEKLLSLRTPPSPTQREEAKDWPKSLTALLTSLEKLPLTKGECLKLRQNLALRGEKNGTDWDEVEQVVLGLSAVRVAERALALKAKEPISKRDKELDTTVSELLKSLAFPPGANSPLGFRKDLASEAELKKLFGPLQD